MMAKRNFRHAIQTTILCLSLIYISLLVVWTAQSSSNQTQSFDPGVGSNASNKIANDSTRRNMLEYKHWITRRLKHISKVRDPSGIAAIDSVPSIDLNQLVSAKTSNLTLNDLYISVKTTRIFHKSRLEVILNTWFRLARNQTYFFTDDDDAKYNAKSGGHLINTNCSASHNRKALCCKMSVEFDSFIASNKKWFCHFDDDNYVNVPQLLQLLRRYDPHDDWYLGKPSIKQPLEIQDRDLKKNIRFWFATGGAGFCISKALALKMIPIASDGKMISVGERIRLPDDVTIGYIIEHMLGKRLTVIPQFHSHLESMTLLSTATLVDQISFSYSGNGKNRNVLSLIKTHVTRTADPTRFYSLHCHLFPKICNLSYNNVRR